jgi:transposase-like protein
MYSYEDRIRAVKLYIKLGKRAGPTIRQLGYPTKTSLKSWCREYEQNRELQVSYVRLRHKYSDEQMRAAVEHYLNNDRCMAFTIRTLGYPGRAALAAWIEELHPGVRNRIVGRAPSVRPPSELKNAAVIDLCTRKTSVQVIAQKLAVSRPTLYNWKNRWNGER